MTRTRSPIAGRIWATALGAILATSLLAACGSSEEEFPRAAEPADSPPPFTEPAGEQREIGGEPEGLVFDPATGTLAAGLRDPGRIAFIDPRTLQVQREVKLPGPPRHLAYAPDEHLLLVPSEPANDLIEISPAGTAVRVEVGNHPHDAAAIGATVFVADEHSDQVSVLRGGGTVATLPAPKQPGGIAAAGRRYVALVAVAERVLQVYDAKTLEPLGRTDAGVGPSHVVADGRDAYVADTQGDEVRRFRVGPEPREIASVSTPGTPYGLAIDHRRERLWVTLTARNRLLEFSTASTEPRLLTTYPTVRQPNSVAVEPRSGDVFVAGRSDGDLQRIHPDEGEVR